MSKEIPKRKETPKEMYERLSEMRGLITSCYGSAEFRISLEDLSVEEQCAIMSEQRREAEEAVERERARAAAKLQAHLGEVERFYLKFWGL